MSELDWAAGFIDGEGHIRATGSIITVTQHSHVGVECPDTLERLRFTLGGVIDGPTYTRPVKGYMGPLRPRWEWRSRVADAPDLMEHLVPRLSAVKRRQAEERLAPTYGPAKKRGPGTWRTAP